MAKSARVLSAAAIAVASVFMMMAPAGASSSARMLAHRTGHAAAAPNSDLSGKGAGATFTPKKLTAPVYKQAQCAKTKPPVSFTLTNATKNAYPITYNGGVAFTVPKKSIENVCVSGKPSTISLGISGSTHTLTVKLVKPA